MRDADPGSQKSIMAGRVADCYIGRVPGIGWGGMMTLSSPLRVDEDLMGRSLMPTKGPYDLPRI